MPAFEAVGYKFESCSGYQPDLHSGSAPVLQTGSGSSILSLGTKRLFFTWGGGER